MTTADDDARWMERALALAAQGEVFRTDPNPRVGAVLVRDGQVVGEGFHAQAGGPHAEALAFAAAGGDVSGATLYVTLEPCGPMPNKRTPPCLDAVRTAGVRRIVAAMEDPNPAVAGRSLAALRSDGREVVLGVGEDAARRLNQPYCKWATTQRPYVTAKWAMSLDGKIAAASGDARWISGETSRQAVHVLRGQVDAIAVGIGTALADDPSLTRRGAPGKTPLRVVLDAAGRLPLTSQLVTTARETPVLVCVAAASAAHPAAVTRALEAAGVEVARLEAGPSGGVAPEAVLACLAARGVRHLLLEGGGGVLAAFFAAQQIDRVQAYVAPKIVGGAAAPTPVMGAGVARVADAWACAELEFTRSGEDVLLTGLVRRY